MAILKFVSHESLGGLSEFYPLFSIQMPVVPLQRPDELNIPSPSWMQTGSGYEDTNNVQGIPTMITWSYGGKEVAVEGSWDGWKSRLLLLSRIFKTILYSVLKIMSIS